MNIFEKKIISKDKHAECTHTLLVNHPLTHHPLTHLQRHRLGDAAVRKEGRHGQADVDQQGRPQELCVCVICVRGREHKKGGDKKFAVMSRGKRADIKGN